MSAGIRQSQSFSSGTIEPSLRARSRGQTGNTTRLTRRWRLSPDGGRIIWPMKPTYADIAECVEKHHGFVPKTCWIAHVKELNGLPVRVASNRQSGATRVTPCPKDKRAAIEDCFRRLGLIRKRPRFECPHCDVLVNFTHTRVEDGIWPCCKVPFSPKEAEEISSAVCLYEFER